MTGADYLQRLRRAIEGLEPSEVDAAADELIAAHRRGGLIFLAGNGGSATTASHAACDLAKSVAPPGGSGLRVQSLGDNVGLLSAIASDRGFEHAFSDQLASRIGPADALMVFSVRGASPNILRALCCAREHGARTVALVGGDGGTVATGSDVAVLVPDTDYGIVEDVHLAICHAITERIRAGLTAERPPAAAGNGAVLDGEVVGGDAPTILFVSANESAPWGASETSWYQLALRLAERGCRVLASVRRWRDEAPQLGELERAGVRVLRRSGEWAPGDPALERPVPERHARVLYEIPADLTLISQGDNWEGWAWLEEAARAGRPYLALSHSTSENFWPSDEIARRLRDGYAKAAEAMFVAPANRTLTEKQIGAELPNASIFRTPYAVAYDNDVPPLGAADGPVRFACVARLDPTTKGQDLLVEVLAMEKWRRRSLTVTLYGAGPNEDVLRRLIARRGLESVEFGGHVGDVEGIWRTHHGLVLPSREEGLPTVIVEAMLCGRVVIATEVAGNPEFVQDDVTGFLAAAPTVRHLDEALERAWAARVRWPEMGERAAEAIRREVPPDPIGLLAGRVLRHTGLDAERAGAGQED